jgi:hypothetical protein
MRRLWLLAVMVGLSVSASASQMGTHLNALEPVVKSELKIPTDVIIGTCMIRAGTYVVMCDREQVSFTVKSTGEVAVSLPCRGNAMKDKAKETLAVYEPQPSGYIVLEKLYLKGSNIEHVF